MLRRGHSVHEDELEIAVKGYEAELEKAIKDHKVQIAKVVKDHETHFEKAVKDHDAQFEKAVKGHEAELETVRMSKGAVEEELSAKEERIHELVGRQIRLAAESERLRTSRDALSAKLQ
eukprot:gene14316-4211_t